MTVKKNLCLNSGILILLMLFVQTISAQNDPIKFSLGEYNFKAVYDTTNYSSVLTVNKKGNNIYSAIFIGRIDSIHADNLNKEGQTNIFVDNFSGGAHCCFNVYLGYISDNSFTISDSLSLGNSDYEIKDLNGDEMREVFAYNDVFAYAFTNYAQSEFSPLVFTVENNKFINVTSKFPGVINSDIERLKTALKTYTDKGFSCPAADTANTFNTDAGAVKAILAPLVMDYFNLGEVQTGYEFVNSVYSCPDKDKFISILKNEYKLK